MIKGRNKIYVVRVKSKKMSGFLEYMTRLKGWVIYIGYGSSNLMSIAFPTKKDALKAASELGLTVEEESKQ